MKNAQHVRGKWVARVTVPDELRPIIGKRELTEELPTEAKARAPGAGRASALLPAFGRGIRFGWMALWIGSFCRRMRCHPNVVPHAPGGALAKPLPDGDIGV